MIPLVFFVPFEIFSGQVEKAENGSLSPHPFLQSRTRVPYTHGYVNSFSLPHPGADNEFSQINPATRSPLGADSSRPTPIYRPPLHVPSALESAAESALIGIFKISANG